MKKLVRIMGLCALVALAFSSCRKNENTLTTFKASAAKIEADSKTHLNGGFFTGFRLVWDEGDEIRVFNHAGESRGFIASNVSGGNATFHVYEPDVEFMADFETPNSYTAFYPNVSVTDTQIKMSILAEQTYTYGVNFLSNTFPMHGTNVLNPETQVTEFAFSADAGALVLQLMKKNEASADPIYLDSLVVVSSTEFLSGDVVYNRGTNAYDTFIGSGQSVSLVLDQPIEITKGSTTFFTFVLPAGTLSRVFTARGYYQGPSNKVFEISTAGDYAANTIGKGKITAMPTIDLPQ